MPSPRLVPHEIAIGQSVGRTGQWAVPDDRGERFAQIGVAFGSAVTYPVTAVIDASLRTRCGCLACF